MVTAAQRFFPGGVSFSRAALGLALSILIVLLQAHRYAAQERDTATPVPAVLHTPTPERVVSATPTFTPTLSPTPLPAVRLRVIDTAGNVNIRALPSLDGEILGTITAGIEYQALRNYYRWYEFRYDLSPTGRGWVYGDLVEIVGDRSKIVVVDNPADIAVTVDLDGAVPDAGEDEAERAIAISTIQAGSELSVELAEVTSLPTFTPPAATPASFAEQMQRETRERFPWTNLPPIVPVAALAGLGVLGILLNVLRR